MDLKFVFAVEMQIQDQDQINRVTSVAPLKQLLTVLRSQKKDNSRLSVDNLVMISTQNKKTTKYIFYHP